MARELASLQMQVAGLGADAETIGGWRGMMRRQVRDSHTTITPGASAPPVEALGLAAAGPPRKAAEGYRLRALALENASAEVVRRIFAEYLDGRGIRSWAA